LCGTFLAAAKTTIRDISEQEGDFTVRVSTGTPPQNFRLLVSHDDDIIYVMGKDCDTGVCPYRARFDGSKSSTYARFPKDYFFVGNYDTNGGYAFPARDDIKIGDVTIRQAAFGVAVNNSMYSFVRQDEIHYEGVLGQGNFRRYDVFESHTVPVLKTALAQKAVDKSLYTIWLQRQDGGNCEYSKALLPVVGSLTLGDYNKNKCSHTINWHPLRARFGDDLIEEYAMRVDAVSYGSHVYFLDEHVIWTAKLDAGHNVVLYAPKKIADDI
ncbi:cathepsin D, partial [Aphelenchoides avenae]